MEFTEKDIEGIVINYFYDFPLGKSNTVGLDDGFTLCYLDSSNLLRQLERKFGIEISDKDASGLDVGGYSRDANIHVYTPRDIIHYISKKVITIN